MSEVENHRGESDSILYDEKSGVDALVAGRVSENMSMSDCSKRLNNRHCCRYDDRVRNCRLR